MRNPDGWHNVSAPSAYSRQIIWTCNQLFNSVYVIILVKRVNTVGASALVFTLLGHQQPWYWLCNIDVTISESINYLYRYVSNTIPKAKGLIQIPNEWPR